MARYAVKSTTYAAVRREEDPVWLATPPQQPPVRAGAGLGEGQSVARLPYAVKRTPYAAVRREEDPVWRGTP
jgi:hypothetical protein